MRYRRGNVHLAVVAVIVARHIGHSDLGRIVAGDVIEDAAFLKVVGHLTDVGEIAPIVGRLIGRPFALGHQD